MHRLLASAIACLTLLPSCIGVASRGPLPLYTPGAELAESWEQVSEEPGATPWSDNGEVLACSGVPTAMLRTIDGYDEFILTLEYRWLDADSAGNSGLLLLAGDEPAFGFWPECVEVQMRDGQAGDFFLLGQDVSVEVPDQEARQNGIRIPRTAGTEATHGEWNQIRCRVEGGRIDVWLNGVFANACTNASPEGRRIALQSEGAPLEVRRFDVQPLDMPLRD